jgi:hypothetical protein
MAGGGHVSGSVEVMPDPMDPLTDEARRDRWSFLLVAGTLYREASGMRGDLREMGTRIEAALLAARADTVVFADLIVALAALQGTVSDISRTGPEAVMSGVSRIYGDFTGSAVRMGTLEGPTATHRVRFDELEAEYTTAVTALAELRRETIPDLDRQLRRAGLPTIAREDERKR